MILFAETSVLQINERPIPGEAPQNVNQILTIAEDKLVTGQTFEAAHLLKQAVQGENDPTETGMHIKLAVHNAFGFQGFKS